jgi:hypothetical protein
MANPAGSPAPADTGAPAGTASPAGTVSPGGSAPPAGTPAPAARPSQTGSASPSPSATTTATAAGPAVNPNAGSPDLAKRNPVDPAGAAINLKQSAAQAATSLNCTLTVPGNPLSAKGLATPWQLGDGCSEANPNLAAFAEATIIAPNGHVSVYDPLVVTQGTSPAAKPAAPKIPRGSQMIIDTGFNGNNLVLEGAGAAQGRCIDAFGNSVIAQTAACNASAFYQDANSQIARGTLKVPALGTGGDGKACETTRSFSLIDQDQSDNVLTKYLLNGNGQSAQASPANHAAMAGATPATNGSDNGLLGHFVDAALGCKPFTAANPTSPNGADGSQALNELSARQGQRGTIALVPVNDPQLLVGGQFSIGKTNTYRMLTDQQALRSNTNTTQNAATYCQDMVNIAPAKLQGDAGMEAGFTSPVPATGNNLATFMGARLAASFTNLNCQNFGLKNPVTVTTDGNGVATAVTYSTAQQKANAQQGTKGNGGSGYDKNVPSGRRGHKENAGGM